MKTGSRVTVQVTTYKDTAFRDRPKQVVVANRIPGASSLRRIHDEFGRGEVAGSRVTAFVQCTEGTAGRSGIGCCQ
ncbi:hypothetical protein D3C79_919900 [compost metagenome]